MADETGSTVHNEEKKLDVTFARHGALARYNTGLKNGTDPSVASSELPIAADEKNVLYQQIHADHVPEFLEGLARLKEWQDTHYFQQWPDDANLSEPKAPKDQLQQDILKKEDKEEIKFLDRLSRQGEAGTMAYALHLIDTNNIPDVIVASPRGRTTQTAKDIRMWLKHLGVLKTILVIPDARAGRQLYADEDMLITHPEYQGSVRSPNPKVSAETLIEAGNAIEAVLQKHGLNSQEMEPRGVAVGFQDTDLFIQAMREAMGGKPAAADADKLASIRAEAVRAATHIINAAKVITAAKVGGANAAEQQQLPHLAEVWNAIGDVTIAHPECKKVLVISHDANIAAAIEDGLSAAKDVKKPKDPVEVEYAPASLGGHTMRLIRNDQPLTLKDGELQGIEEISEVTPYFGWHAVLADKLELLKPIVQAVDNWIADSASHNPAAHTKAAAPDPHSVVINTNTEAIDLLIQTLRDASGEGHDAERKILEVLYCDKGQRGKKVDSLELLHHLSDSFEIVRKLIDGSKRSNFRAFTEVHDAVAQAINDFEGKEALKDLGRPDGTKLGGGTAALHTLATLERVTEIGCGTARKNINRLYSVRHGQPWVDDDPGATVVSHITQAHGQALAFTGKTMRCDVGPSTVGGIINSAIAGGRSRATAVDPMATVVDHITQSRNPALAGTDEKFNDDVGPATGRGTDSVIVGGRSSAVDPGATVVAHITQHPDQKEVYISETIRSDTGIPSTGTGYMSTVTAGGRSNVRPSAPSSKTATGGRDGTPTSSARGA